jgi:hypothetical protein
MAPRWRPSLSFCSISKLREQQMPKANPHVNAAAYIESLCLSSSRSKLDGMNLDLVPTPILVLSNFSASAFGVYPLRQHLAPRTRLVMDLILKQARQI